MHTCLFDIDGTLISTGGAGKMAMEAALRTVFGITEPCQTVPYAGRTDRAISADLLAAHGVAVSPALWEQFRDAYLGHLPVCLKERPGAVLRGAAELVSRLAERSDVHLGLLTGNIQAGAQHKLVHYGLHHHFRFGGYGDRHHHRDDVAREAFEDAVRYHQQQVDPAGVWVIGDTIYDIRCGRAIGARVVAVATGGNTREELAAAGPDYLLDNLQDTAELRELWG